MTYEELVSLVKENDGKLFEITMSDDFASYTGKKKVRWTLGINMFGLVYSDKPKKYKPYIMFAYKFENARVLN